MRNDDKKNLGEKISKTKFGEGVQGKCGRALKKDKSELALVTRGMCASRGAANAVRKNTKATATRSCAMKIRTLKRRSVVRSLAFRGPADKSV